MISRILSVTSSNSCIALRPRYPVKLQSSQPTDWKKGSARYLSGFRPDSVNSWSSGVYCRLQCEQSILTSRCASTQLSDETKLYGSTPHVEESPYHVYDVVGVNRGEDQMARQRRLDGYLRRLRVADLADHYLVWVVAQYASEPARKRQPLLLVDGYLCYALELILDRVFDSDDLVLFVLDLVERRVKRGRLSRPRRPRDEHHPVRLRDELSELAQILRGEPHDIKIQLAERLVDLLLVQDTNDDVLAVYGRHDRDAEIDLAPAYAHAKAAVPEGRAARLCRARS